MKEGKDVMSEIKQSTSVTLSQQEDIFTKNPESSLRVMILLPALHLNLFESGWNRTIGGKGRQFTAYRG